MGNLDNIVKDIELDLYLTNDLIDLIEDTGLNPDRIDMAGEEVVRWNRRKYSKLISENLEGMEYGFVYDRFEAKEDKFIELMDMDDVPDWILRDAAQEIVVKVMIKSIEEELGSREGIFDADA